MLKTMIIAAGVAAAASAAAADTWTGFNAIIRNDLSSVGDVEGAVLVGGNVSGNNIFGSLGTSPSGLTLGVAGNVVGNLNLNSGNARIGGLVTSNVNNNGGGSITQNDAGIAALVDLAWNEAVAASAAFAGLSGNSSTSAIAGNKLLFDAADGADFAVFNLDASDFSTYQEFVLQRDGASTIVINVSGGASDIDVLSTVNSFTSSAADIVWNFLDAMGTIDVQRQMEGTVLATEATIRQSAVIEGTVVALSAMMNGQEFHLPTFAGDVPGGSPIVPLPGPGALAAAGLSLVALRRRR